MPKVGSALIERSTEREEVEGKKACFVGKCLEDTRGRYIYEEGGGWKSRGRGGRGVILISSCTWPTAV